ETCRAATADTACRDNEGLTSGTMGLYGHQRSPRGAGRRHDAGQLTTVKLKETLPSGHMDRHLCGSRFSPTFMAIERPSRPVSTMPAAVESIVMCFWATMWDTAPIRFLWSKP